MKRVVIVRHAKSVPYGYDNDFYRDLTDRGVSDADKISLRLRDLNIAPDVVISSTATRAIRTAQLFCKNLNFELTKIQQMEDLYEGITTQRFIELLQDLPDVASTVFVFGHNPTVYYLVYNLVKYFNSDMPTCSAVVLDFEIEKWEDISARGARVNLQLTPKNL